MLIRILALTLTALPIASHADMQFGGHVGLGMQRENLQEFGTQDNHLLTEQGQLPAFSAAAELQMGALTLSLHTRHNRGSLHYDGKTSAGNSVSTETDYRATRLGLLAGFSLKAGLGALLGVEHEQRQRDIRPVGTVKGLNEDYELTWLATGLRWQADTSRGKLSVAGLWLRGIRNRQTVESSGLIDSVAFKGGRLKGYRFEASLPLARLGATHFSLQPRFEYLDSARSENAPWTNNGVASGTLAQPETHRWTAGLELVAGW